jgi:hypothetical protein
MRRPKIFPASHAFTRAHVAASRAVARGDLRAADKWLRIAERHQRLAINLYRLCAAEDAAATQRVEERALRQQVRAEAKAAATSDAAPEAAG